MKQLATGTVAARAPTQRAERQRARDSTHDGKITAYDAEGNPQRRFSVDVAELVRHHGWTREPPGKAGG